MATKTKAASRTVQQRAVKQRAVKQKNVQHGVSDSLALNFDIMSTDGTSLAITTVQSNECSDVALAKSLHKTRGERADLERLRYLADTKEYNRDIARFNAQTAAVNVDRAALRLTCTEYKFDAEKVKATYDAQRINAGVNRAAQSADNAIAGVEKLRNIANAKGITVANSDRNVVIELPTFKTTK